ncbi:hypothetical protein [Palaeococcus ferrophilus]|uniref:hypothetical protein n=1 Tax=Palaeococcus ferrophilus TaxID=83868 RepID=UPI0009FEFB19|nr:hypothetical protein [Palaeococcus ferrophilus]
MDERLLEIKELIERGKVEAAYSKALKIGEAYWRSYALKWVAEALVRKDPGRALSLAGDIGVPTLRDETFLFLTYELSRMEKFREAIMAAKSIRDTYLKKKAFRSVSSAVGKAIARRGVKEISLSELDIDESDVEYLKPLPKGLEFKDGKFIVGSEIHGIKGEVKEGILTSEPLPKKVEKPEFGEVSERSARDVLALLDEGKASLESLPEPLRFAAMEELGLECLERGDVECAERYFRELPVADYLGRALAWHALKIGREVGEYIVKIYNPAIKMALVYESIVSKRNVDRQLLRIAFGNLPRSKKGRLLKFLAFELLDDAKKRGDRELMRLSKELFVLGKNVGSGAGDGI